MANDKDKKKVKDPRYDIYTTGTNITDTFGGWDDRINNNQETNVEIPREFPKENPYSDRAAIQAAVQQQALNNRLQPNNQEIPDRQRAVFPSNIPPSVGFAVSSNEQEMRNAINGKNGMASPANAPQVSQQVQTQGRNPYADRAAVQAAIESQAAQAAQAQTISDRQQFYSSQPRTTTNPYADRAEAQMMATSQPTQQTLQQPYNLFAQQKQTGYPNTTTPNTGQRVGTDKKPAPVSKSLVSSGGGQRKPIPITNTDELARAMGYTSPEEEERLRKASLANMRIMAVADAIRHIGNIVHTTNGAPAQKLTSAVQDEYDRYRKGKALRDAANYKYLSYQQQKAAQDQRAKQWEQQFNLNIANAASQDAYRREQARIAAERAANDKENKDKMYELGVRKADDAKKANEDRLKLQERLGKQRNNIAAGGLALRREEYEYKKNNGYYSGGSRGTKTANGNGKGYTYSTKRGSVTIPSDYLSKNKINKKSLMTAMERAGAIDTEWLDRYDRTRWDEKAQDKMLDDAVSNWLMNDDAAEDYMVKHLKGQSSHTDNGKSLGIGIGSENEKGKSLGLGL